MGVVISLLKGRTCLTLPKNVVIHPSYRPISYFFLSKLYFLDVKKYIFHICSGKYHQCHKLIILSIPHMKVTHFDRLSTYPQKLYKTLVMTPLQKTFPLIFLLKSCHLDIKDPDQRIYSILILIFFYEYCPLL